MNYTLIRKPLSHINTWETLFDEVFNPIRHTTYFNEKQAFKVDQDDDTIYVCAEIPGFDKEDISIEYKEGELVIKSDPIKNKTQNNEDTETTSLSVKERLFHSAAQSPFHQRIQVGDINFKKAQADYKNGILQLTLPKKESEIAQILKIK